MSKKKKVLRFQPGDRVAEKPKDTFMQYIAEEKRAIVAQNSAQRLGTVVKLIEKRNRNGVASPYFQVRWDNNTTGEHAQCRLCFEIDLPQVLEDHTNKLYGC
jgi:hypothetical protein